MPGVGFTSSRPGQARAERLALGPYWGKPTVRNLRGGGGNVGIFRSPVRATALPDRQLNKPMDSQDDIRGAWRVFLIELELARNYPIAYQLSHGPAVRNPVLEKILPSLLHIKMAALLDEALDAYLTSATTALPKTYRSTLDAQISFLSDSGRIQNGPALHAVRNRRNELAHETCSSVSWSQLDQDLPTVHATLQHLGVVGGRPRFEIKAERSAAQSSEEPGVIAYFDYSVTLAEGEKTTAEFRWRETLHNDEAN